MKQQRSRSNNNNGNSRKTKNNSNKRNCNAKSYNGNLEHVDIAADSNINDSSYYYTDDNLKNSIVNFSFNQFLGARVELGDLQNNNRYMINANIMRIALSPSAGFTPELTPATSGINMAGLKNYTILSASNAKTTQYGPQDVTLLILALGSLCTMVSYGTRTLGMAYLYNQRNRAYPVRALIASGIDGNDLLENLANYRIEFNTLLSMINKIPFFADLKYFEKSLNLYSSIYLDQAGSAMAQSYIFVPESVWQYDEAYSEAGGGLKTVPVIEGINYITFRVFLDKLRSMIESLLTSSLLNYVYADVLRILDKEGRQRLVFATVPEDYAIVPVYNPEISLYINNAMIMGNPSITPEAGYTNGNDVKADANTNSVIYRPQFERKTDLYYSALINFMNENPTLEDRIAALRFASRAKIKRADPNKFLTTTVALADYYVASICFFYSVEREPALLLNSSLPLEDYKNLPAIMDAITKFDYAPYLYVVDASKPGGALSVIGDTQYYTTIDYLFMKQMYDVEFMGEFELR